MRPFGEVEKDLRAPLASGNSGTQTYAETMNNKAMGASSLSELLRPPRKSHLSIAEEHELGSDIYRPLLTWVVESGRYEQWRTSKKNWQLSCYGSPGSGKTTLSAMVASHLRKTYAGEQDAVAAVFVHADVRWDTVSFIEDLLASIFRQLCKRLTAGESPALAEYSAYLHARRRGQRSATRFALLRQALTTRLSSSTNAFLVLDGLDRCTTGAALFVQEELTRLQRLGLRIMTTSRIPWLKESFRDYCCDGGEECPEPDNPSVYWECQKCISTEDSFVVCHTCYFRGQPCLKWCVHGHDSIYLFAI